MSQVMRRGRLCIGLVLFVLLIAGCSSPNTEVGFDPNTGKHTASWLAVHGSAYMTYNGQCAGCHGNRLNGGISAVDCFSNAACHATAQCGTCHTIPPSGAFFPNTAGKHAGHMSLPSVNFTCDSCHTGAGGSTPNSNHMNYVADVVFSSSVQTTYRAKTGTIAYDAASQTCSKISCHGGQTTPNWVIGSLDVNNQCGACHVLGTAAGSPEWNSYYSGQHNKHVNQEGIGCTECHDTVKLAVNHFTTLNTTAMEGPALATIRSSVNYNGTTCNPACHDQQTWK